MMDRLWISGLTATFAMALAAWEAQKPADEAPAKVEAKAEGADPNVVLDDVYVKLRRLRGERLADRPKALADDAARLYRDAIKALEEGDPKRAAALSDAARELVRAVELAERAQRGAQDDPELPPPPSRRMAVRGVVVTPGELPPAIPGGPEAQASFRIREGADALKARDVVIAGDRVRLVRPSGEDKAHDILIEDRKGQGERISVEVKKAVEAAQGEAKKAMEAARGDIEKARAEAEKARATSLEERRKGLETLKLQLKELKVPMTKADQNNLEVEVRSLFGDAAKKDGKGDVFLRKFDGPGAFTIRGGDAADKEKAIRDLKHAYESVSSARKAAKEGETKGYLDTARDLYNAARKDAEAGRYDRAAELARAAEALSKASGLVSDARFRVFTGPGAQGMAPHMVPGFRFETRIKKDGDEKEVEGKREVKEFRIELKDGKPVAADGKEKGKDQDAKDEADKAAPGRREVKEFRFEMKGDKPVVVENKDAEKKPEKVEVRIVEGKETKAEGDDAGSLEGIGVMISFEGGKAKVVDLIESGPAARDGRLKKGDLILGVETEEGLIGFAGKPQEELTKSLRGPSGSKVKILVQPDGSSDLKVYEIERARIDVPKAEEKPGGALGADAPGLPPVIE